MIAQVDWLAGGWGQIIAQLGAFGVVCWVLYHGITHIVPEMQRSFSNELKEERRLFTEENRYLRESIAKDREGFQRLFDESHQLLSETVELRQILAENQRLTSENQKVILENQQLLLELVGRNSGKKNLLNTCP